jgi:uncharacterized membrane protein
MFISTFGITRPRPDQQHQTNLVIGGSLLMFLLIVFSVLGFLIYQIVSSK